MENDYILIRGKLRGNSECFPGWGTSDNNLQIAITIVTLVAMATARKHFSQDFSRRESFSSPLCDGILRFYALCRPSRLTSLLVYNHTRQRNQKLLRHLNVNVAVFMFDIKKGESDNMVLCFDGSFHAVR